MNRSKRDEQLVEDMTAANNFPAVNFRHDVSSVLAFRLLQVKQHSADQEPRGIICFERIEHGNYWHSFSLGRVEQFLAKTANMLSFISRHCATLILWKILTCARSNKIPIHSSMKTWSFDRYNHLIDRCVAGWWPVGGWAASKKVYRLSPRPRCSRFARTFALTSLAISALQNFTGEPVRRLYI